MGGGCSKQTSVLREIEFFTDMEHGSKDCKVPASWRRHNSLMSVYSLSSLLFCLTGLFYLVLAVLLPERVVWGGDYVEALLWIWCGMVSYQCDVVDLGIPSWSHPIDRISATLFTLMTTIKHVVCSILGRFPLGIMLLFPAVLGCGILCFHKSCAAVHKSNMKAYFFWHSGWHFTLSLCGLVYYGVIYLGPKWNCYLVPVPAIDIERTRWYCGGLPSTSVTKLGKYKVKKYKF